MKTAPDPKDVQEFLFKQSHTSQILDAFTSVPTACSLLTADKKRGLLYVGQNNKIIVLKPGEDTEPEWKLELNIAVAVSKLMLNCDCSYLAVAPHGPLILIYDVQSLVTNSIQLLYEIRISTSNTDVFVNDLRWNPTVPGMLCTVASDYTVGSFKIKEKKEKTIELKALEKFNDLDVLCAAWSPKGKQIVVGCKNGSIVQFKPDLKVARTIPGPDPYIGEVIGILWISNYQFCAAYLGSEQKLNVLIIDAPKGETNAIFTCYEDITYGITDTAEEGIIPRYYFDHVPEWGLIIAASSNSSEVAVLGSTDGGVTWNQWQLVDSGRAELPLICTTESYPVGLAIDKSSARKLPWGAESTLPYPVPMLHILSTSGQLCSFHMVNLIPNCPDINSPPTEVVAPPSHLLQSNVNLSETSIVMNGLITSTPRPKQLENVPERPKPIPTRNIFDKSIEGNSFFGQSVADEKPKQLEQKSESASTEVKMESVKETVESDIKLATLPMKEAVSQESVKRKASALEDDGTDIRAYIKEHNLFEKELRNKLEPQIWECGTEEERRKLVETSAVIDQFLRELRETTNSLSSDIAYLKALLLQSFAWVEETKSKNAATNDITTRNCGDTNKISDLQKLYYYTHTQLSQASKILDLEWSNHKSREMSRMKIPHLEFVYQNLILHNKIIQEEKSKLEHLKKRWKLITRNNNIFSLNRSLSNLSITSSKSSTSLPRNAGVIEARCKTIASKTLSFTQEKQIKLREHLSVSSPRIIKPVNPSPIQHRLEATLSSLDSLNTTVADTKNKTEHPGLKQITPTKPVAAEKPKQQSPLASLNSIVARIGTSETNNVSTQNKQLNFGITFPAPSGNKLSQVEKKSAVPITSATVSQSAKPKQDSVPFGQVSSSSAQSLPNLTKSFAKVNTITFGTPAQKSEVNTAQKSSALEESGIKSGKENVPSDTLKVENNLFGTGALKDVLSETTSDRVQGIYASNSIKFRTAVFTTTATKTTTTTTTSVIPTTTKIEAATTFSFATPNTPSAVVKSMSQNALTTPQTSAQTFSFALKPSNATTAFNLKMPPTTTTTTTTTTASQTQDSLNITNLIVGLQTSNQTPTTVSTNNVSAEGKYNYKPTFGAPSFQMLLGQNNTSSNNQISISLVSGTPSKETVTTTSSVTIENILSTKSKALSLATSSAQASLASSTRSFFNSQINTPNISVFGGMPSSTPSTSTFTVATTSPGIQITTTSSIPIFGGFTTPSITSSTATTVATTSSAVSPSQSSLTKPTFGEAATNLSTVSAAVAPAASITTTTTTTTTTITTITTAVTTTTTTTTTATTATTITTTTSTLNFGSITTASVASVFGKPASTMSTQFSTTPVVSSTASTFGKSVISPTSMPFGSSTNASIFGQIPTTSTNASVFSGSGTPSIFGGNTQASPSASIFGGDSSTGNTFGTSQKSIFDNNAQNSIFGSASNSGSTSFFGGTMNNTAPGISSPPGSPPSVFGGATANASQQMGLEQPAFGQAPAFGAKPVFGSPPTFGASKLGAFGGGFGAAAFGASASPPAFGSLPAMGGTPASVDSTMPKVFGNVDGSNTFESLASQSGGLSFSSLAQKNVEAPKSPVFTSGSSFSTWR